MRKGGERERGRRTDEREWDKTPNRETGTKERKENLSIKNIKKGLFLVLPLLDTYHSLLICLMQLDLDEIRN